tara:strand:+ start:2164 stop:2736 length:573 start_codon:yes stop_codon:yes gene_type:complete
MKLYDIQNNAIQVAVDTCIQNLYELRNLFESPHDLEDHSLWTLNLLYEYLTDEVVVIKDVMNDTEYPESYQYQYDEMIDGLNRIRSVMIKKLADGEELFHTDFKHLVELKMKYDGDEFPKIEFDADEYMDLESALELYRKKMKKLYKDDTHHNYPFLPDMLRMMKLAIKLRKYARDCSDYVCDNINKWSK